VPVLMRPWGHMHYRHRGDGPWPVLFLNSLGTDLRMWDGVVDLLPQVRAIGVDKRGHGLSATPDGDWSLADLAGDALALMDHLGIDRAVIAGCSIGGMVAQWIGARAPDRVTGLVLSNTALKVGTAASWQDRIDAVTTQGLRRFAPQIMARWFGPAFRASDAARAWENLLMRGDDAGYIATCRTLAQADLTAVSPSIRCPVLMIAGTDDLSTPPEMVRATAAVIPGARVAVIDGAGHIPAIDSPAETARLIAEFLQDLQ
jgi:3-oxoadipate enol-lactonase